jgi:hypothetical protein
MKRLDAMPAKLEEMYALTMQRIENQFDNSEHADLAKRALLWVIHSEEPLTLGELRYAVACSDEDDLFDESSVVPEAILLSACAGLVIVEGKRNVARLIRACLVPFCVPPIYKCLRLYCKGRLGFHSCQGFPESALGACPRMHHLSQHL